MPDNQHIECFNMLTGCGMWDLRFEESVQKSISSTLYSLAVGCKSDFLSRITLESKPLIFNIFESIYFDRESRIYTRRLRNTRSMTHLLKISPLMSHISPLVKQKAVKDYICSRSKSVGAIPNSFLKHFVK